MARVSSAITLEGFSIQTSDNSYTHAPRGLLIEDAVHHKDWLEFTGKHTRTSGITSGQIQTGYETLQDLFKEGKFKLWTQVQQDALLHSGAQLGKTHNWYKRFRMDCTTGIRRHLQEEGELDQEDYKILKKQFQTRETTQDPWEEHHTLLRTQDWGEVPLYDINTSADWGRQAEQVLTASDGSTDPETGETGWATILCEEGTHTVLDQELEALAIGTSNNSSEAQGIITALKKKTLEHNTHTSQTVYPTYRR